uniref:Ig-like domain-containing protein n=1 Tax=Electrophorus electricus TaxID=8005 RepID=A0A4W4DP01_ELEEL
ESHFLILSSLTAGMVLTLGSPDTLILVAEPGDDVTLWYQYNLMKPAYIHWFKHTDHSVPDQLHCQFYKKYYATSPCDFIKQSNQIVMSVNSQNTSLTITAVNYTDSGLYYCGIWHSNNISFSNATYLQVTGNIFVQDSKYAAVQFSDKKIKKAGRHTEVVDTKVVYSSVRH